MEEKRKIRLVCSTIWPNRTEEANSDSWMPVRVIGINYVYINELDTIHLLLSTDFMDEYLEPARSAFPDIHYGMTTLSAEIKKDKYSSSIHHQQHSVDDRLDHTHHTKSITTRTS